MENGFSLRLQSRLALLLLVTLISLHATDAYRRGRPPPTLPQHVRRGGAPYPITPGVPEGVPVGVPQPQPQPSSQPHPHPSSQPHVHPSSQPHPHPQSTVQPHPQPLGQPQPHPQSVGQPHPQNPGQPQPHPHQPQTGGQPHPHQGPMQPNQQSGFAHRRIHTFGPPFPKFRGKHPIFGRRPPPHHHMRGPPQPHMHPPPPVGSRPTVVAPAQIIIPLPPSPSPSLDPMNPNGLGIPLPHNGETHQINLSAPKQSVEVQPAIVEHIYSARPPPPHGIPHGHNNVVPNFSHEKPPVPSIQYGPPPPPPNNFGPPGKVIVPSPQTTIIHANLQKNSKENTPQIVQLHIPSNNKDNDNAPTNIIQIHFSTTTPRPDKDNKDYFSGSTFKPPVDTVNNDFQEIKPSYGPPPNYPNTEYRPTEQRPAPYGPPLPGDEERQAGSNRDEHFDNREHSSEAGAHSFEPNSNEAHDKPYDGPTDHGKTAYGHNDEYLPQRRPTPGTHYNKGSNQRPEFAPPQEFNRWNQPEQGSREEIRQEYAPPREEVRQEFVPQREEVRPEFAPPREEGRPEYGPPRDGNRQEYGPPRDEVRQEYGPPRDEVRQEYGPPRDEVRQEYAPPREEARPAFAPPREEPRPEFAPPRDEGRQEYAPPREEDRQEYGHPRVELINSEPIYRPPPILEPEYAAPPPPPQLPPRNPEHEFRPEGEYRGPDRERNREEEIQRDHQQGELRRDPHRPEDEREGRPKPEYGAPKLDYGPPKHEYIKPHFGPPKNEYIPPKGEYSPHKLEYIPTPEYAPPKQEYGPPKIPYGPPKQQEFGPPKHQEFGPPKQQEFGPPKQQEFGLQKQEYGPPKHEYNPPKQEYSKEHFNKHGSYEAGKFSQPDPLYHPEGDVNKPSEEISGQGPPPRYDNSFSSDFNKEKEKYKYAEQESAPHFPALAKHPSAEEVMEALGLSESEKGPKDKIVNHGRFEPLNLMEYLKTKGEQTERSKEPLYGRQDGPPVYHPPDSGEVGYPGTSYKMPHIDRASKVSDRPNHFNGPQHVKVAGHPPQPLPSPAAAINYGPPPRGGQEQINHHADSSSHEYSQAPAVPFHHAPLQHHPQHLLERGDHGHPLQGHPPHGHIPHGHPPHGHIPHGHPSHGPPPPVPYGSPPPQQQNIQVHGGHVYNPHNPPHPNHQHHHVPQHDNFGSAVTPSYADAYPMYVTEPEPIIEIIVQDSNVTLPPLPKPVATPPPATTPEPVHVFYVRYSANNKSNPEITHAGGYAQRQGPAHGDYGSAANFLNDPQINLEKPVASIPIRQPETFISNNNPLLSVPSFQNHGSPSPPEQHVPTEAPLQTTTLRALIRPDKNEYSASRLGVTFDHPPNPDAILQHHLQQQQKFQDQLNQLQQQQAQQLAQQQQQQAQHQVAQQQAAQQQAAQQQAAQQQAAQQQAAQQQAAQQQAAQQQVAQQQAAHQQAQHQAAHQQAIHQAQQQAQQNALQQVQLQSQQQAQQVQQQSQQQSQQLLVQQGQPLVPQQQLVSLLQPLMASPQPHLIPQQLVPQQQVLHPSAQDFNNVILSQPPFLQNQQPAAQTTQALPTPLIAFPYGSPQQSPQQQPQQSQQQTLQQSQQQTLQQLAYPQQQAQQEPSQSPSQNQYNFQQQSLPEPQPTQYHPQFQANQYQQVAPSAQTSQQYQQPQQQFAASQTQVQYTQQQQEQQNTNNQYEQQFQHRQQELASANLQGLVQSSGPSPADAPDPVWTDWNPQQQNSNQNDFQASESDPQANYAPTPDNFQQQQQQQQQQQLQQQQIQNRADTQQYQQFQAPFQPSPLENMQPPATQDFVTPFSNLQMNKDHMFNSNPTPHDPPMNSSPGSPLGLGQMRRKQPNFDNIGMSPPLGPVYPGFSKRIGLDELSSFLENNNPENQRQSSQEQAPSQEGMYATESQPSQYDLASQGYTSQQQLVNNQFQQQTSAEKSGNGRPPVKLPDDVPEDLKQQLVASGILGNADIQVINFDENLFKELGDLPPEALAALGQQSAGLGINPTQLSGGNSGEKLPSPSNLWQGGSESLTGDHASDLSAILGSRTVREVLVVRNNRPRPKRGGLRRNVLLFITDKDDVLLYNIKKRSLTRIGNTHKPIIARALELSNHKFNIQSAE